MYTYLSNERAVSLRHDLELRVFADGARVVRVAGEAAAGVLVEVVARVDGQVHASQHRRARLDAIHALTALRQATSVS